MGEVGGHERPRGVEPQDKTLRRDVNLRPARPYLTEHRPQARHVIISHVEGELVGVRSVSSRLRRSVKW